MTLHQAIEQVLQETERPMTSREIADVINDRRMFFRQDEAPVPASQISARANNYEMIFTEEDGKIGLVKNDSISLGFERYRREIKKKMDFLYKSGKGFDREEILNNFLNQIKNEDLGLSTADDNVVSEPQPRFSGVVSSYKNRLLLAYKLSNWYLSQNNHWGFLNESFAQILSKLQLFHNATISVITEITGYSHFLLKVAADNPTSTFNVRAIDNEGFLNESFAELINSGQALKDKGERKIGFFVPPIGINTSNEIPFEFKALLSEIVKRKSSLDRALLVLPTDALISSTKPFVNARRRIIESKMLEGVIGLPDHMMQGSGIKLSLLLFDFSGVQNEVLFLDASQIKEENHLGLAEIMNRRQILSGISKEVFSEEIRGDYNLAPLKYVSNALLFPVKERHTVEEIGKLLLDGETGRRILNRGALYSGGQVKVIQVADLRFDTVQFGSSKNILAIDQDQLPKGRKLLTRGGIVISVFNQKIKAHVLPDDEEFLIDQGVFWIKPDPQKVIAEFLVRELHKPYVKEQVGYYSKGTILLRMSFTDLLKIKVQIPSLEEQKEKLIESLRNEKAVRVAAVSEKELDFIKTLKHSLQQPVGVLGNDFTSVKLVLEQNENLAEELNQETFHRMERAINDIEYILEQADQLIEVTQPVKKGVALRSLLDKLPLEYQDVEILTDGPEVQLSADPKQLRIMFHNFIHNALRHGFKGIENPKVWIEIIDVDDLVVTLAIRNNGKALNPQFTIVDFLAKGSSSSVEVGSGFGGFLIGLIVQNHNGEIVLGRPETSDYLPYNVEFIVTLSK